MIIFIIDKPKNGLKGDLSKWLLEVKSGVFVGNKLSAVVREELVKKIRNNIGEGSMILIYSYKNEQGFKVEHFGNSKRCLTDYEGLSLVTIFK